MAALRKLAPTLERQLLRRAAGERAATELRCADCRRIPLIGERVHLYRGGKARCELCRPLRREEPLGSELVHGPAYGHCVVRVTRVAA
jgi:hypothetical protein